MLASDSPLAQLTALRIRRYCVPICAIEPSRTAVLPVRWQSSRAICGVSLHIRLSGPSSERLLDLLVRDEAQEG